MVTFPAFRGLDFENVFHIRGVIVDNLDLLVVVLVDIVGVVVENVFALLYGVFLELLFVF